jgi:hypothetical protein
MTTISNEYGKWLSTYKWTHVLTIRRHFRMSHSYAFRLCKKIIESLPGVKRVFFSLEKDSYDHMNHLHIIAETDDSESFENNLTKASGLIKDPSSIKYLKRVGSSEAVAWYSTKCIGHENVDYDMIEKGNTSR